MDDKLINIISTDIIIRKLIQKKQIFNTLVGGADVASKIEENEQAIIELFNKTKERAEVAEAAAAAEERAEAAAAAAAPAPAPASPGFDSTMSGQKQQIDDLLGDLKKSKQENKELYNKLHQHKAMQLGRYVVPMIGWRQPRKINKKELKKYRKHMNRPYIPMPFYPRPYYYGYGGGDDIPTDSQLLSKILSLHGKPIPYLEKNIRYLRMIEESQLSSEQINHVLKKISRNLEKKVFGSCKYT